MLIYLDTFQIYLYTVYIDCPRQYILLWSWFPYPLLIPGATLLKSLMSTYDFTLDRQLTQHCLFDNNIITMTYRRYFNKSLLA